MPHEVETMAYAGATPWHGLGTALAEEDLYDWQKACTKAGLNWDVELVPLVTADTHAATDNRHSVEIHAECRNTRRDDVAAGLIGRDDRPRGLGDIPRTRIPTQAIKQY